MNPPRVHGQGAINTPSNGSGYGYFDYNYAGTRMGYMLWQPAVLAGARRGRNLVLTGNRVGINNGSPSYEFDVAGEGHITGTMRTDVAFSLLPQGSAPGASAAYGVLYVNSAGQLRFIRRGGGDYYVAG